MDGLLFLSKEERGAVMDEAKQGVTRTARESHRLARLSVHHHNHHRHHQ
jgi:hypothetical protein